MSGLEHRARSVARARRRTAERLAAGGLKYRRFHTTALCSPTRQALLTGRNHHSVGMGGITEIASGSPGYCSVLPNTASPLARTLKLNGYATAQFGKCHEVPVWETSPAGPFDAWPTGGGGFEYFYGFIGGEAHQRYPSLYEGTNPIEVKNTPEEGYHFMEDMTDKAIGWIGQQKALIPDKPFFIICRMGFEQVNYLSVFRKDISGNNDCYDPASLFALTAANWKAHSWQLSLIEFQFLHSCLSWQNEEHHTSVFLQMQILLLFPVK